MTLSTRERLRKQCHTRARERFWSTHDREDYTCPMCGHEAQGLDREFDVHHIDGDWLNNHPFNLVAICHRCHVRVHRLRNRAAALDEWRARAEDLGKPVGEERDKPITSGRSSPVAGWSA